MDSVTPDHTDTVKAWTRLQRVMPSASLVRFDRKSQRPCPVIGRTKFQPMSGQAGYPTASLKFPGDHARSKAESLGSAEAPQRISADRSRVTASGARQSEVWAVGGASGPVEPGVDDHQATLGPPGQTRQLPFSQGTTLRHQPGHDLTPRQASASASSGAHDHVLSARFGAGTAMSDHLATFYARLAEGRASRHLP